MRFARIFALGLIVTLPALAADLRQQKVDQIFASYDKAGSPGCALGVIQDGNFVYRRGYGMASLELGVPLSPQSVFYMGSVSKQFTAASVVLAAEQGYLSLDDDVRKYIPELPNYGHTITLRQMLHHTSGLRDYGGLLALTGQHDWDFHAKDKVMDLIVRQKSLNFVPGDQYSYSNTNYFLLAEVVKRATKKSLADFAAENIFRPLGMTHTRFYDDRTLVIPDRVPAYAAGTNGKFLVDWSTTFELVGAGGLLSSIDDLLLWDRNFYQNKLGKGTLVKEMRTPAVLNNGQQMTYALGLDLGSYRGLSVEEHNGANYAYRAGILRFPNEGFTAICLCNVSNARTFTLSREIADVYLQEKLLSTEPSTLTPSTSRGLSDPARFAGDYLDFRTQTLYSFMATNGNLMGWGGILRRVSENQFRDLGTGTLTFDDSVSPMRMSLEYENQLFFAGSKIERPRISQAALTDFAGTYKSSELGITYTLSVAGSSLVLKTNWNASIKLTPIAQDEFESDLGIVLFHRDSFRRISSLGVFSESIRNLSFEKAN